MKELKVQCPAKINLTLEILGKRDDGFHELKSIMQTINLFDYLTIKIEVADELEIHLTGNNPEIPYDEHNLVYKAIMLYANRIDEEMFPFRIDVDIKKHIPVAAGLAGGSTDAAGVLFGLNEYFDNMLSREDLHELCAKLGSDLNFCLEGGRQMTTGRGEKLEKLEFEELDISLIKPENLGISAKEAYTKFSERGHRGFVNDLEGAVIDDYKELQTIKKLYPQSIMSGSGSTYFAQNTEFKPIEGYWIKNNLKTIDYGVKLV